MPQSRELYFQGFEKEEAIVEVVPRRSKNVRGIDIAQRAPTDGKRKFRFKI